MQPAPIGVPGTVPGYLPSAIAGHSGSSTALGRSSSGIGGGWARPFPFALPAVRRYARLSDFAEDRLHAHELYGQRHDDPPDRRAGGVVHTDPGVPAEPEPGIVGREPLVDGAGGARPGRHGGAVLPILRR